MELPPRGVNRTVTWKLAGMFGIDAGGVDESNDLRTVTSQMMIGIDSPHSKNGLLPFAVRDTTLLVLGAVAASPSRRGRSGEPLCAAANKVWKSSTSKMSTLTCPSPGSVRRTIVPPTNPDAIPPRRFAYTGV